MPLLRHRLSSSPFLYDHTHVQMLHVTIVSRIVSPIERRRPGWRPPTSINCPVATDGGGGGRGGGGGGGGGVSVIRRARYLSGEIDESLALPPTLGAWRTRGSSRSRSRGAAPS